jgi:hypothetical protein
MDSLTEQVRCSRVFFFFLTNNVFRSPWCILELVEADKAGAILVPVLVEGAGWGPHGVRKVRVRRSTSSDCVVVPRSTAVVLLSNKLEYLKAHSIFVYFFCSYSFPT